MYKITRQRKHKTIRKRIKGTSEMPRLAVFRSSAHIYAQIIDDSVGKTLVFETDLALKGNKKQKAFEVGQSIALKALKIKIERVVFDRGGFIYHGRIAELGRGAREGGLKF